MTVVVSFFTPRGLLSLDQAVLTPARRRENLAPGANGGGTTSDSAQQDECVMITNCFPGAVAVAFGSAPDASTATASASSSAGLAIASGLSQLFKVAVGDKVNAKVVT